MAAMDKSSSDPDAARAAALASDLRVLIGQLTRRLREQANASDLTASQKAVLLHLERSGPSTVTALARAEGVRSQSMGATVALLEAAGWVSGAPDPADGRQTLLSLTDACREWVLAGRAARQDWLFRTIQARFTPAEHADLAAAVALLERLVAS